MIGRAETVRLLLARAGRQLGWSLADLGRLSERELASYLVAR